MLVDLRLLLLVGILVIVHAGLSIGVLVQRCGVLQHNEIEWHLGFGFDQNWMVILGLHIRLWRN